MYFFNSLPQDYLEQHYKHHQYQDSNHLHAKTSKRTLREGLKKEDI